MRGIVNYNTTNNLNRWEILFFDNHKIYHCPINNDQLPILEQQDNGTEIEFKINLQTKKAILFPLEPTNKFFYYNFLKGILAFQHDKSVILYSTNGLHDTMHVDYFKNEYENYEEISLKQFLFIYDCLTREPFELKKYVTSFEQLDYYTPKYKVYSEKCLKEYKIEIDPYICFMPNIV